MGIKITMKTEDYYSKAIQQFAYSTSTNAQLASSSIVKKAGAVLLIFTFLFTTLGEAHAAVNMSKNSVNKLKTAPIRALIGRILPGHQDSFVLTIHPSKVKNDESFKIEIVDHKIHLTASTPSALTTAFNHYLKYTASVDVSWWKSDAIRPLKNIPMPDMKLTRKARTPNRFLFNYCTYGYSFPFWQWSDWERMIDWLALNGVTMPLATAGQEAVWLRVWKKFGLTDHEIRSYFTGPAHLGWHRMSNIDKWGGPLPKSYINGQEALQKRILVRMRSLGMTPVLPAFAGHVPASLKRTHPQIKITNLRSWGGSPAECTTHLLDMSDPLFSKIQKAFLKEQTKTFGTDHIYGIDPFNELKPPSWEPDYLAKVGKTIYNSLTNADPEATWVQMGWMFFYDKRHWTPKRIKAFMSAVPVGKLMMLDYHCEKFEIWKTIDSFYNQPFIWCYLGNFGGNPTVGGAMQTCRDRFNYAAKNAKSLSGIGSTLEGIDRNPHCYEYLLELAWTGDQTNDIDQWLVNYGTRRAGSQDKHVQKAWKLLGKAKYKKYVSGGKQASILNSRPTISSSGYQWTKNNGAPSTKHSPRIPKKLLLEVLEEMLLAPKESLANPSYQHDIQVIATEVINEQSAYLHSQLRKAWIKKDSAALKLAAKKFLALFDMKDAILDTRAETRLATWVNDARSWSSEKSVQDLLESNAKNLITTWSVSGNTLNDYSARDWSGLTSDYYKKRWIIYLTDLIDSVEKKQKFDNSTWDKILKFESNWYKKVGTFNKKPSGDLIKLARKVLKKYK